MTSNGGHVLVGTPRVAFASCHITPGARAHALDVMARGWLTMGERTEEFENRFASWVGARNAIAVSSCTAALELCLRALDLPQGAPVLTPTMTFCGAVNAIVHAGLQPVFVDVDPVSLVATPETVARAAHVQPAAMIVQHMAGYPADVPALAAAAGLSLDQVVEDAAHGLGGSLGNRPIGTLSRATCFSFYATKNLPIGEGGAITTGDQVLADRLRALRQHGMTKNAWRRYQPGADWRYDVDDLGLKANFTDLQAAIGLGQLDHLRAWQARREELAHRYDMALAGIPGLLLPARPDVGRHAWHLYPVQIEAARFGTERDALASGLSARGIATSVHFIPVHRFRYYRELMGDWSHQLPGAEIAADRLLSLPLHPQLSDDDVHFVCEQVRSLRSTRGVG